MFSIEVDRSETIHWVDPKFGMLCCPPLYHIHLGLRWNPEEEHFYSSSLVLRLSRCIYHVLNSCNNWFKYIYSKRRGVPNASVIMHLVSRILVVLLYNMLDSLNLWMQEKNKSTLSRQKFDWRSFCVVFVGCS